MKKPLQIIIYGLTVIGLIVLMVIHASKTGIAVLDPAGYIASRQRDLLVAATLLSLIVIVPVLTLLFAFGWKYRESNTKARYTPNHDGSFVAESIWWGIPIVLILILSVMIWRSSHELDPYRTIQSTTKPVRIQVIALPWKWLFIYPDQNIATINYIQVPQNTPIEFEITSDAAMNSFWIPRLGGQVYAMAGMTTKLSLMANQTGSFNGLSSNISGEGFSGMKFITKSTDQVEFYRWVDEVRTSSQTLDAASYAKIAKPSSNTPPSYYASTDATLYDTTIMKYMMPAGESMNHSTSNGHTQ